MGDCRYNSGVSFAQSNDCIKHCGFMPKETRRRKRAIDKGLGLILNKDGLRHLEIKRGEKLHVNAD